MNFKRGAAALLLGLLLCPPAHAATAKGDYWAEAQISEARPYVQQTLVYMILVISKIGLEKVEHSAPSSSGMALERIDEQPLNYPFNMDGRRYNITAFRYALTPLTLGKLEIPPAKVKVTPGQRPFAWPGNLSREPIELETNAINLDIQPPVANGVKNWLPLASLKITGKLENPAVSRIGEPFTLTLIQDATGAGGEELPSLEALLQSKDFKVYPERPSNSREVVPDGSILVLSGQRTEVYTLIPQREGDLQLPPLDIHWWNVRKKQAETTTWLPPVVRVGENGPASGAEQAAVEAGALQLANLYFWMGVEAVVLFLLGWWVGKGYPGSATIIEWAAQESAHLRRALLGLRQWLARRWHTQRRRIAAAVVPYVPQALRPTGNPRQSNRFSARLGRWLLPRRLRMLWHLRQVDSFETPGDCASHLQDFAHLYLNMPRHSALPRIGQAICRLYPRLDSMTVISLMRELDAFMYAPRTEHDLIEWQRLFRGTCQFLPFYTPQWEKPAASGLPALNPREAA